MNPSGQPRPAEWCCQELAGPLYDALVIGSGAAGATAALLLARSGWRIGIVESASFPRRKVCGEFVSATNLPLLRDLGIADAFHKMAGPEVHHAGLFYGRHKVTAPLPCAPGLDGAWGQALGREHLDSLLLDRASAAGATVWQPWSVTGWGKADGAYRCRCVSPKTGAAVGIKSRILVAAHGSWHSGHLPTQPPRVRPAPGDLLAFKAHFRGTQLPLDLMPLVSFPGGYGGMVHADHGRTSVSFCIQRRQLDRCRREHPGQPAAEAVLAFVKRSCTQVREVLEGASRDGDWLAAGPLHPGIRVDGTDGIFLIGNAAGEAHPVIAEGISMALQSAWLLKNTLSTDPAKLSDPKYLRETHQRYTAAWRKHFAWRIQVSAFLARWTMSPMAVHSSSPLLRSFPGVVTLVAKASGKAHAPLIANFN